MIVDFITDIILETRILVCTSLVLMIASFSVTWWRGRKLPPGPWGIPFIGAAPLIIMSKDRPPETFLRWSRTYGKIFSLRVGNRIFVILNDFDLIQQALNHKQMQDRPTQTIEAILKASGAEHGVSSGNGLFWQEQRRFMHSALRDLGVTKSKYEAGIQSEVQRFTERLLDLEGGPFDPYHLIVSACCNIICGFGWGRQYSYDDPELLHLIDIVSTASTFSISASALGTFPWLRHIPYGPHMKFINVYRDFHRLIDKVIADRCSKLVPPKEANNNFGNTVDSDSTSSGDSPPECLLDAYLLEMNNARMDKGSLRVPLRKGNVYSNMVNLFFAGSDTVATTLLWLLVYLLRHPEVQARCHAELDAAVGGDRTPGITDRDSLPYLQATIAEVQRISNVTPVGIPRAASENVSFEGFLIPEKAVVIANFQAVVKNPDIFERSEEFDPGRFLNEEGKYVRSPKLLIYGAGPRKCLGEHLAQMELFVFAATLLHRFELTVPVGEPTPSREGITGVTVKPHPFQMCSRSRLTDK